MKRSKIRIYILSVLCIALLTVGCRSPGKKGEKGHVSYAGGFRIIEKNSRKTILTDSLDTCFTILHHTTANECLEPGTIIAPVTKVISTSAPAVPLISVLDEVDSLAGVKLPEKAWHIKKVRQKMAAGDILLVGNGSHEYLNYEQVIFITPAVIFNNMAYPHEWSGLLRDRGIHMVSVHTHLEDSLLGQFEWIKMIGAFYNKGDLADDLFEKKLINYQALKKKAQHTGTVPKILWGTVVKHRASVPGGKSFIANTIRDAGGEYLLQDELKNAYGAYIPFDLELFFGKGIEADVLILSATRASGIDSLESLKSLHDMYKTFTCVKEKNVWCYRPWFWQSVDKPDEILKDLIAIIHSGSVPDTEIKHFERL